MTDGASVVNGWPKACSPFDYPEPRTRGTRVRDADGNTWERKNTLWHHVAGPDEWRGRWPFSYVVYQYGPLLLL